MQNQNSEPQNGIWGQWTADQNHQHSPRLAAWMAKFLEPDAPTIDFGCGTGFYLKSLHDAGFTRLKGVEGFPLNNFMFPDIQVADLSKPIHNILSPMILGNVISLEVGEHIPEEFEQTFLDNITTYCSRKLIISWALPGQPGVGHVNCKPQDYIIRQLENREFVFLPEATADARLNVDDNCDWFRRTLLVFEYEFHL